MLKLAWANEKHDPGLKLTQSFLYTDKTELIPHFLCWLMAWDNLQLEEAVETIFSYIFSWGRLNDFRKGHSS